MCKEIEEKPSWVGFRNNSTELFEMLEIAPLPCLLFLVWLTSWESEMLEEEAECDSRSKHGQHQCKDSPVLKDIVELLNQSRNHLPPDLEIFYFHHFSLASSYF